MTFTHMTRTQGLFAIDASISGCLTETIATYYSIILDRFMQIGQSHFQVCFGVFFLTFYTNRPPNDLNLPTLAH
jgi:hypothetical protein